MVGADDPHPSSLGSHGLGGLGSSALVIGGGVKDGVGNGGQPSIESLLIEQIGVAVGINVGTEVGLIIGDLVGFEVGFIVGSAIGLFVGATLGFSVGILVGDSVGSMVGADDPHPSSLGSHGLGGLGSSALVIGGGVEVGVFTGANVGDTLGEYE